MLGDVPATARRRLLQHYGQDVDGWLAAVPEILATVAGRWGLRLVGYHDAGCASVLCTAMAEDGRATMVKAWFDSARYRHEVTALGHWSSGPVPRLRHSAGDLHVAAMDIVGGAPGGRPTPDATYQRVARSVAELHQVDAHELTGMPNLGAYLAEEVRPDITRRLPHWGRDIDVDALDLISTLDPVGDPVLLHSDLYRENVAFDEDGRAVLLDPLPMLGTAAFDWAFWVVYFDLGRDQDQRLSLASRVSGIPARVIRAWCLVLCVHGLLFYRETGDDRAGRMSRVLTSW